MVIVPSKVHHFHHTELNSPKAVMEKNDSRRKTAPKIPPTHKGDGFPFWKGL